MPVSVNSAPTVDIPLISPREHNAGFDSFISAKVARIVSFKEMRDNEKFRNSVKKEYDELQKRPVWNESKVREYDDVHSGGGGL